MSNDTIKIQLSKYSKKNSGKHSALVDLVDADLDLYNWTVKPIHAYNYTHYAVRTIYINGTKINESMHRVILARKLERDELLPTELVDHIDGNGLNNTRDNLRLATPSQNNLNTRLRKDNKSSVKGINWDTRKRKFIARVQSYNQRKYIGQFDTFDDAKRAIDDYIAQMPDVDFYRNS